MANYAIMRIEKRKLPSVGRINKHHERQKEEYKSNPDCHSSNYLEPFSSVYLDVLSGSDSVLVRLNGGYSA